MNPPISTSASFFDKLGVSTPNIKIVPKNKENTINEKPADVSRLFTYEAKKPPHCTHLLTAFALLRFMLNHFVRDHRIIR